MPTDAALENAWYQACQTRQAAGTIPGWGDAICWNELHHTTLEGSGFFGPFVLRGLF